MIRPLNYNVILNLFLHVKNLLELRRNQMRNLDSDMDLIKLFSMSMAISLQYLQMCALAMKIIKLRHDQKTRLLLQPHKLIRFLRYYR